MAKNSSAMVESETGKTTAIRLLAVRETGVSRHHRGGPIKCPLELDHAIVLGFEGALN